MHSRYGKASASAAPRGRTSPGSAIEARRQAASSATASRAWQRPTARAARTSSPASASSAKPRAASLPSPSSRLANNGTNAELKAPSPNRRRNRFGKRNATKNASATAPDPERGRDQYIAHEPEDAAHHRQAADGGEGAIEFHEARSEGEGWWRQCGVSQLSSYFASRPERHLRDENHTRIVGFLVSFRLRNALQNVRAHCEGIAETGH